MSGQAGAVKCGQCGGNGICIRCEGQGVTYDGATVCPVCNRMEITGGVKCYQCQGTGCERADCRRCAGTGNCSGCAGSGWVLTHVCRECLKNNGLDA